MSTAPIGSSAPAHYVPPGQGSAPAANLAGVPDPSQRHHGVKGDAGSAAPSTAGKSH
jgi:hypothetical protein